MTLEAASPQDLHLRVSQDPRQQLAELFRKPTPAVTVIVKKRRLTTDIADTAEPRCEGFAVDGQHSSLGDAARKPRVYRTAKPLSDETAQADPAQPAMSREVAPPRRRRVQDPLRRPGEVRIVVQTPAAPQGELDDMPVWQRLLSRLPEAVTYQQVRRALDDLRAAVIAARFAAKIRII